MQYLSNNGCCLLNNYFSLLFRMNQGTLVVATLLIISVTLISTSTSTVPIVDCEPNALTDAPTKIRQLCYYVLEQLRSEQSENGK